MRKISRLLFGLSFMMIMNSCSKEVTFDELSPSSVETTSVLKEWATKNDKLNQADLIEWEYTIPITLPDSIKGYSAPVKNKSGFKEYITFEIDGKKHGLYKSYKRLNDFEVEIIIQSVEGKTLQAGIIRKNKGGIPKGKSTKLKEKNLNLTLWDFFYGIFLPEVTVTAPSLYQEVDYIYNGTFTYSDLINFYDINTLSGGAGSSSLTFDDYNDTQIVDKLTDPCFKAVLSDLKFNKINNLVGDIVRKFVNNPNIQITFKQKFEVIKNGIQLNASFDPNTNEITLSESKLKNASIEFIAITIIHELFHAKIGNIEQLDHTQMLNEYVKPAGEFMNELYGLNSRTAENLFIAGLEGADGYLTTIHNGYDMYFHENRKKEIDRDILNYVQEKISGNHCK